MFRWVVLASTIVFWGLAFTAIKVSVAHIDPISIAALRFAIADALFVLSIITGKRISREDLIPAFLLGLSGVTIYHVFLNLGEMYVSSGVASLIIALAPSFVFILSWAFLDERISPMKVAGMLTAFSGVALISEPSYANVLGILAVLVSAVSAAVYTAFGKKLMGKYDALTLTCNSMVLGSVPLFFFVPSALHELMSSGVEVTASIVFLGIFPTYLGYLGWYYFLEKEEASKASIFLLAIPLVSILSGYVVLGEEITSKTVFGAVMILLGIYLVLRG